MTPKRRASRRTPPRSPTGTEHFPGALVEELRGQFQIVLEAVVANGEQISVLGEQVSVLGTKVSVLDTKVDRLDAQLVEVRQDLAMLRHDGRELAAMVARKADGAALIALEHRVARLERAAG